MVFNGAQGSHGAHLTAALLFLLLATPRTSDACRIHGTESGICIDPDNPNDDYALANTLAPFESVMPFCHNNAPGETPIVRYRACIPLPSTHPKATGLSVQEKEWSD